MLQGPADILEQSIQGRELDGYTLELGDFKRGRTDRETYFNLFLKRGDTRSKRPIIQGLYFMGRGEHIKAWIEFRYTPRADFTAGTVDLEEQGLTSMLLSVLGELIPAGGSMMIIYGAEPHPLMVETERGLKRDFPPLVTPLGYYLWNNGFRWYKDWYFPEGWMEGGMKLQATYPLDERIRREREKKTRADLEEFIRRMRDRPLTPLEEDALSRAEDIFNSLKSEV